MNCELDLHSTMILEEFDGNLDMLNELKEVVENQIQNLINKNNLYVTAVETRIKDRNSLANKLILKGGKYGDMYDITDLLGARVITFYNDEVDKVAALVEHTFQIDWENSVDKRKIIDTDKFGYQSLHYICRVPKSLYKSKKYSQLNDVRFEIQMRTTLQHAWSTLHHDTGYKSGIEIPKEYLRSMNRLAGILELVDDEFCRLRVSINEYRRKVEALVRDGKFDDIILNGDSFISYLNIEPFRKLTQKIAAINQAEIFVSSFMPYLKIFLKMGCKSLGDIERIIKEDSDDAYKLALHQIGGTDLDIISSTIAAQDLCIVHILKNGGGEWNLTKLYNYLYGKSEYNKQRAQNMIAVVEELGMINK